MSINNKRSYTEYTVVQPTTDFAIGFDDFDEGSKDIILVTLNGVLVETLGYAAIRKNESTVTITPAITEGTVRLTRETDIDEPFHKFTAGALFSAKSMDENFQQVRHSQQEVRDGFVFLEYNTNGIVQASKEATAQAKAATVEATASAVRAETAADTAVQAVGSLQGVVDAATTATSKANTATATATTAASQATAATTSAQNAAQAANTAKQEATTATANANAATVDTLAATGRANEAAAVVADLVVGKVRAQDVSTEGTLNQSQLNRGFASMSELILISNPKTGLKVDVNSYHLNKNCGGGTFMWDATLSAALHNGGTVISPSAVLPIDWDNQGQLESWLYPVGLTGTGCWVRQGTGEDNIQVFGALPDGVARVNLILERMADLGIAIYVPKGIYRVEDFTRKLRINSNLDQKSMRIFGEETFGSTDQGYSWSSGSVFQGSGDMFKAIVNVRLDNLLFRNTPNGTLGKIFTLGGFAQCEWSNCIFGPSNYHIYNPGKGMVGYNVKPSYRNCRFYGAKEWSRYFEGVVANYREENCYTSTNKRGLYMACPMTTSIESCVYEYNEDGAIILDLYGYSTTYSLNIKDVFFETNGAGVPGSGTKSLPHIQIKSEDEGTGAPKAEASNLNFKQENCYYTDTSSGLKAESNIFVYSKTVNIVEVQCWTEVSLAEGTFMYSGSLATKVDVQKQYPDTKVSIITIGKEIRAKDFRTTTATPLKVVQGNTVVAGSACLVGYDRQVVSATAPVTYSLAPVNTYVNGRLYVTVGEVHAEYTVIGNTGTVVDITQVSMVGNTEPTYIQVEIAGYPDFKFIVKTLSTTSKFCFVSFIGSVGI